MTSSDTTFQVIDTIDGKGGVNSINLTVSGTSGSAAYQVFPAATVSNLQKFNIRDVGAGGAHSYDFSLFSGETLANSSNSTKAVTFANLGDGAAVGVSGTTNAAVTFSKATASNAVDVILNGATGSNANITNSNSVASTATSASLTAVEGTAANAARTIVLTSNGTAGSGTGSNTITSFTINAGSNIGATTLTATDFATTATMTILGAGTVSIAGGFDGATINAAGNTGGVTITTAGANALNSYVGSAVVDTLTLGAALKTTGTVDLGAGNDILLGSSATYVASTNTVSGGTGTDRVGAALINAGNAAHFTNFEVLSLNLASGALDTSLITGSTIANLSIDTTAGGTYQNVTTAQSLLVTSTDSAGSATLSFAGVTGTADSYSIAFNGAAQTATPTSANISAGTVEAAGIEIFNVASTGAANTWNSLTLGADANAETVVITGGQNLTLGFASGFGDASAANGVSLIDGSAATGKTNINVSNVGIDADGLVIKGGAGVDTITTSSDAYGTIYGGAANDAFVLYATVAGSGYASAPIFNTLADAIAGDTIQLKASSATAQSTLGAAQSTASATTLVGALSAIADATAACAWGTYGGNTYIVFDDSSAGLSANDVIVKLTGVQDLSAASLATTGILTLA